MTSVDLNVFAPGEPHATQWEVLNDPSRFKVLRAGRKWRKSSLLISWLAAEAYRTRLACPYIAPNRVQAKNIVWRDHMMRLITELKEKGVPHKINESELSVTFPGNGKIQLFGVESGSFTRD